MFRWFRRLRARVRYRHFDRDLQDELDVHRAMVEDDLRASRRGPDEIRRAAARRLGNVTAARESVRAIWIAPWLEGAWQDVRYSTRTFTRRPLMWSAAILSLALGIGGNAAAFSLYEQVLRRQLAVDEPSRIVNVTASGPRPGARETDQAGGIEAIFSLPLFRDLEALGDTGLEHIAASAAFPANFAFDGDSDSAQGLLVSGGYFDTLGVRPAAGRLFAPSDDQPGSAVVVVSNAFWRNRLGAVSGIVGAKLVVNGRSLTVIGIAPAGFTGTTTMAAGPDVFVPLALTEAMGRGTRMDRQVHWLYVTGRLRSGVSRVQAEARVNVPFAAMTREVDEPALRGNMGDRDRAAMLERRIHLEDGSRGRNANRSEMGVALGLLAAVAISVLLIAAANVANLLLARTADRSTEIALRLAVGASSGRLVRWLLTEACLLGIFGGVLAVVALEVTVRTVLAASDAPAVPVVFDVPTSTYLFAVGLGGATGLGLGLLPALHGVRAAGSTGLLSHGARMSSPRATSRYRAVLATTQVTLATALLSLAGLFLLSVFHVTQRDLGLRPAGVLMFGVSPGLNGYTATAADALKIRLEETLGALPGVSHVTTTTLPLLTGSDWGQNVSVAGAPSGEGLDARANRASVGPNYFRTLGIPVLSGREFSRDDVDGAPRVAVVNQAFARKFQLEGDVVGTRMALGQGGALDIEIVGLVGDSVYSSVRDTPPPQVFLPRLQDDGGAPTLYFYLRTDGDAALLLTAVRRAVAAVDVTLPVTNLRTFEEQVGRSTAPDRILATLAVTVAALATILAGIGLYAVLAQTVAVRWRELGIRMALGATPGEVRRSIGTQLGRILIVGMACGVVVAVLLARLAQSVLVGISGSEPVAFVAAVAIALVVSLCAAVGPARRAGAISPMDVLRAD